MVQLVLNDAEENKFLRIFESLINQTLIDIEQYYLTAYKSKELGRIVFEEKLMPIYKVLEKDLFISAFSQILEGEKTLGSIEAYLKILYAIFGQSAEITITKQPLHIQIDIVAPTQAKYIFASKEGDYIVDKKGRQIVFKRLLAKITDRELLQILKATTKAGTFVQFTLNKEEV